MAKNTDWNEDIEAFAIADKLMQKFPQIFEGLDLGRIRFVRDLGAKSRKIGEIKTCSFPYDIDSPYAYYIIVNNGVWKELSEAQQQLAIMHLLYSVAPNGTDETSANYAKCRKHDVKDYDVILAAAGGRYDWTHPGVTGIESPLLINEANLQAKIEELEER